MYKRWRTSALYILLHCSSRVFQDPALLKLALQRAYYSTKSGPTKSGPLQSLMACSSESTSSFPFEHPTAGSLRWCAVVLVFCDCLCRRTSDATHPCHFQLYSATYILRVGKEEEFFYQIRVLSLAFTGQELSARVHRASQRLGGPLLFYFDEIFYHPMLQHNRNHPSCIVGKGSAPTHVSCVAPAALLKIFWPLKRYLHDVSDGGKTLVDSQCGIGSQHTGTLSESWSLWSLLL